MTKAWSTFYNMIGSRSTNVHTFNMMLPTCYDSEQMKEVMDTTMRKVYVVPDVATYTTYVERLMVEGNVSKAQRVVDEEMKSVGIESNQELDQLLKQGAITDAMEQTRHTLLHQWLKEGEEDATAAAWKLFNQLVERGTSFYQLQKNTSIHFEVNKPIVAHFAKVNHFNEMLKVCHDSNQMKELMDTSMKNVGVTPNMVTYNTYVERLMVEGNVSEAKRVVKRNFTSTQNEWVSNRELKKKRNIYKALALPAATLSRMRQELLHQWLVERGEKATAGARNLFDQLVERGVAQAKHFKVMLKMCHDSNQMKEFMDNDMKNAGVTPDVGMYNTYVRQLMVEGHTWMATRVLNEEMKSMGIQPNHKTHELLARRAAILSKMRQFEIAACLNKGSTGEKAAEQLLQTLHTKQLAKASHYVQVIDHLVCSDPKWEVSIARGALAWYRKRQSVLPHTSETFSGEIDLHSHTRGLAEVKGKWNP